MLSLNNIPSWYLLTTLVISCYHGYRGFMLQWILTENQNQATELKRKWKTWEKVSVRCIEDMFFHFICSLSGFLTLFVANGLYDIFVQQKTIDAGASVLLTFSFLIGVIGISGQLPHIIQLGKIPGVQP